MSNKNNGSHSGNGTANEAGTAHPEKENRFRESIIEEPEFVSALAQASVYFSQGIYDKAEPLFRSIPKSFSKYHIAVSGLFNLLWLQDTSNSKMEAMRLVDEFLEEADREDPEIKPVVANFLKIKIDLLKKDEWLK
jgi:hypothetical protein